MCHRSDAFSRMEFLDVGSQEIYVSALNTHSQYGIHHCFSFNN